MKLNFVAVVLKNTPRVSQMTVFLLCNLRQSPYSLKLFEKDQRLPQRLVCLQVQEGF